MPDAKVGDGGAGARLERILATKPEPTHPYDTRFLSGFIAKYKVKNQLKIMLAIIKYGNQYHIPLKLLASQIAAESGFSAGCNNLGACGLGQVKLAAWHDMGGKAGKRLDIDENIRIMAKYDRYLLNMRKAKGLKQTYKGMLKDYNAGLNNPSMPTETVNYVNKIANTVINLGGSDIRKG